MWMNMDGEAHLGATLLGNSLVTSTFSWGVYHLGADCSRAMEIRMKRLRRLRRGFWPQAGLPSTVLAATE